jgi:class 3 adenylate cyclase
MRNVSVGKMTVHTMAAAKMVRKAQGDAAAVVFLVGNGTPRERAVQWVDQWRTGRKIVLSV